MNSLENSPTHALLLILILNALALSVATSNALAQDEDLSRAIIPGKENEKLDTSPMVNWRVFLVGVRNYSKPISRLRYTIDDVLEIKTRLISLGVPGENITILHDFSSKTQDTNVELTNSELPTFVNIKEKFHDFLSSLKDGDVAFCYFSGHGFNLKDESGGDKQRSYFAPFDVRFNAYDDLDSENPKRLSRDESLKRTSISINDMLDRLARSPAKFTWFNVDACCEVLDMKSSDHDSERGLKLEIEPGSDTGFSIYAVPERVLLFQSCSPNQKSYEGVEESVARSKGIWDEVKDKKEYCHGLFTKALLEAIPPKDDMNPPSDGNHDGTITLIETIDYVKSRVSDEASNFHNHAQNPYYTANDVHDFALLTETPVYGSSYQDWKDGNQLLTNARNLKKEKKYRDALVAIKSAKEKIPHYPTIDDEIITIEKLGKRQTAEEFLQAAKDRFAEIKYDEAKAQLEQALKNAPEMVNEQEYKVIATDIDAGIKARDDERKRKEMARQEESKRAEEERQKAESENKRKNAEQAYKDAGTLYSEGNYEAAFKYIQKARELAPDNDDYRIREKAIQNMLKPKETEPGAVKTIEICGVKTTFHWCPPGSFWMGSPLDEANRKSDEVRHEVELTRGFWLCEVPVTVQAFQKFVNATGFKTDAEKDGDVYTWKKPGYLDYDDASDSFNQTASHPVVCVSWNDAKAYVEWLNKNRKGVVVDLEFQLPSEAEWEYACRAGSQTAYWWGEDLNGGKGKLNGADLSAKSKFKNWTVFNFDDGYVFTSPVGVFEGNAWGLKDMAGNVWEWCDDCYDDYSPGAATDPRGPVDGAYRVARGGGWSGYPFCCRSAYRDGYEKNFRLGRIGFRIKIAVLSKPSH